MREGLQAAAAVPDAAAAGAAADILQVEPYFNDIVPQNMEGYIGFKDNYYAQSEAFVPGVKPASTW